MSLNYQQLNSPDKFIVVCFFTPNYHDHALRLRGTLDKFHLNYYFEEVADAGFWEANTRLKPGFILRCLQYFPEYGILYLDADAGVVKPLNYFNELAEKDIDVAFYYTRGLPNMSHDYLASTLYFNNTHASHALVQQWIAEQVGGKRTQVDQDSLDSAMAKFQGKIKVEPLNAGYIKIFDKDYDGEVYIEQYQASREQPKLRRQLIRKRNRAIGIIIMIILVLITYYSIK
nr:hypothetical protein [Moraxella sp. CTOTU47616]